MEDKRITKTKRAIKSTLIDALQETPFEKITVTELCRRGKISRITFYTHYDDKYALAEEMSSDYIAEADDYYHKLQRINNPENQPLQGYRNLLEAILQLFYENYRFFAHASTQENPYLYSLTYNKVYLSVDDYLQRHRGITPKFPTKQTSALLCNGIFGVINVCIGEKMSKERVFQMARDIYQCLLQSALFHATEQS